MARTPGVNTGQTGPKRGKKQREYDRAIMPKLVRQGKTPSMIAEMFGVSVQQVAVDFNIVLTELKEEVSGDKAELVKEKRIELRELKAEAWRAWEKSWEEVHRREMEYALRSQGKPTVLDGGRLLFPPGKMRKVRELTETTGGLPGAQYLKIIFDCIKAERELLGLDAPKTAVISGTMTWDVLVAGLPKEAVPDEIEQAIKEVQQLGHKEEIAPGIVETNGHQEVDR